MLSPQPNREEMVKLPLFFIVKNFTAHEWQARLIKPVIQRNLCSTLRSYSRVRRVVNHK